MKQKLASLAESDDLLGEKVQRLQQNVQRVLIGKIEEIKVALVSLFAEGHLLIEDVPGVGKTTLARALARSIDCNFQRIQFTPDLLPLDVLGVSIYNPQKEQFDFKPGPIFANIILADEINRAPPRTQSSLLEAMNDFQVTVDGTTYPLPRPFMVLATQNPLEYQGTYPLPESQLDRFLIRLTLGYPDFEEERQVLTSQQFEHPLDTLEPVVTAEDVIQFQRMVKEVRVEESLIDYLLEIVRRTRLMDKLEVGVSPRGSLALLRGAQALAFLEERKYCIPDDIKRLALPTLSHRVILKSYLRGGGIRMAEELIEEVLGGVAVPL